MAVVFEVFLPGDNLPVSLDDYAHYMSAVAACGTYEQSHLLPDQFTFDNPKTGNTCSIG